MLFRSRSPAALAAALSAALTLAACAPGDRAAAVRRPTFAFTTTERFDAARVAAYAGDHAAAYANIERNTRAHVENLRRWLRQPSISAQNRGIREMAELVRADLRRLGFKEAELVPTTGHPGVWGYYDAGAAKTLAVYMMYDVQPIEPQGWSVNAFDGALVDHALGRVLMARGATNQKGPERAFLNALEAIIAARGTLPVNLMVVAEGEEELGSPHFPEIIDKYADRLRTAAGVFFPFNGQDPNGDVTMSLGVKGILYFELEAKGGANGGPVRAEIHGSFKAITDSPTLRLTQAIASLTSPDGNTIVVPGYYDPIRPPSDEEQRLVNGMLDQWTAREPMQRRTLGVERWINGVSGRESLMEYLFNTTLNVDGIWSGYTGPGTKTILPHVATAKLDSRLVPNQTPDSALALIKRHLAAKGFGDLEVRQLGGYPPAQTSVTSTLVQAAISVYRKYGLTMSVAPRLAGSAPYYLFTERLKLPLVAGGIGHGSGAHAPDEYMVIEPRAGSRIAGLAEIEKFYVDLLFALAEAR
ncbi:MAG TPA: M20/M25/M40 family metallo-hydrolase [Gemmatimonadaceae bacterium]|nr:M20/M25/M40 family metallo-hydrolase [Gemmatimonadaceae bacterium]